MEAVERFADCFEGNKTAYGVWKPNGQIRADGKQEGKQWKETGAVDYKLYHDHLIGKQSIGIYPVVNGKCKFAVIDIDSYQKITVTKALTLINLLKLPFVAFESKSGGVHLYIFFDEFVPTALVYPKIKGFSNCIDASHIDLRPSKICGNDDLDFFINLPLFGNQRRPLNLFESPDGDSLYVLNQIKPCTIHALPDYLQLFYYYPCIARAIALQCIVPGVRNEFLFNVSTAIQSITEFESRDKHSILYDINRLLPAPLNEQEIFGMATRRFEIGAKTYSFIHKNLNEYCVEKLAEPKQCLARTLENNGNNTYKFGDFKKILTDPIHYTWEINDIQVVFKDTSCLLNSTKFYHTLFEHGIDFDRTQYKYIEKLLRQLVSKAIIIDPGGAVLTSKSTFLMVLKSFLIKRASIKEGSLESRGAYANKKDGVFEFKLNDLMVYQSSLSSRRTLSHISENTLYTIEQGLGIKEKGDGILTCPIDIMFNDGQLNLDELAADQEDYLDKLISDGINEESEEF